MLQYPNDNSFHYGPNALLLAGLARPTAANPIAVQYDMLLVVLIIDKHSGLILDAECNMVLGVTTEFISSLFVGRNFFTDLDKMIIDLQKYYHGLSQRALIVCLKDAHAKMRDRCHLPA